MQANHEVMKKLRIEEDTLGKIEIAEENLWGAQTERSFRNFKIGHEQMPKELIYALAVVKKAAAYANFECGVLTEQKKRNIEICCDYILSGKWDSHFPLVVWQTGSGTQTNMNLNEVIVNGSQFFDPSAEKLSAHDDVNKSQSTNDVFPTGMRIATVQMIIRRLLPALQNLALALEHKVVQFKKIKKIGRTHLMDAIPLTLGEEFSAFYAQLTHNIVAIENSLPHLMELPVGGTAVGNALNAPPQYDKLVVTYINTFTDLAFTVAENKFEGIATHDSFVEVSGSLKRLAVSLMKIANDIRLLASGPRCGLSEIVLPANEPGSSIMPGKVNPTQCEALIMVCCQVIGNDTAITTGALQGQLQLNTFMPLIIRNILHSVELLSDAMTSFQKHCVEGIEPDLDNIAKHLQNSLMLVTALNPHIGYNNAAKIAQYAHQHKITLREAAIRLDMLSGEVFDNIVSNILK